MLFSIWHCLYVMLNIVIDIGLRVTSPNMPKTIHEEVHEIRKILEDKFVVEVSTS